MSDNNVLIINASRARSGGAIAHITEIISNYSYAHFIFDKIIIFAHDSLAYKIKENNIIKVVSPVLINKSIIFELLWEKFTLPKLIKKYNGSLLLNVDAGTICRFKPYIVISQDMLSFEKGIMSLYGFTTKRLRLLLLKYIQIDSIKQSNGVIFLTDYAKRIICKNNRMLLSKSIVINHGINKNFFEIEKKKLRSKNINIIYVSNIAPYKNHIQLVRAASHLTFNKQKITFLFVGGGDLKLIKKIKFEIAKFKFKNIDFKFYPFIGTDDLMKLYSFSDISLFASSCENMPISLMEAMAVGLPIACSNKGPMPEVLGKAGEYFDPENPKSIAKSIEKILLIRKINHSSRIRAFKWTWYNCSYKTFNYINIMFKKLIASN